jgi:signal transduction histidine kinase
MAAEDGIGLWGRLRERMGAIRVRTTAAAVFAVGVTLLIAAAAMVILLQRSLRDQARDSAFHRAEAIVEELRGGGPSGVVAAGDEDEEFVQVLDSEGEVVIASPNLSRDPAVVRLAPGQTEVIDRVPFEDGPFIAVAISSSSAAGPLTVIAGRSLEPVTEASRSLTGLLSVTMPLLLLVVGAVTWRVAGGALAPVDAIRAEVEAISSRELHRRVPDPPGKDEIARLATTMNRMLSRLEDGQLRQRRFVSDASHELRSPVATIRQHAEVALSHPGGTSTQELAEVVLEEDVRLQRIVEDLLLLARIDEGTLQLRRAPVDLDDLMFEEAARLRGSTRLRVETADVSAGRVIGDREKLERLLRNLTENAARHARSAVSMSLRESDGEVVMTVDDDGEGIREAHRERVFDRFVRLGDARDRDSGGSGLGLAIVREIAAFHHGTVVVGDSSLGGARFEVRFPASSD